MSSFQLLGEQINETMALGSENEVPCSIYTFEKTVEQRIQIHKSVLKNIDNDKHFQKFSGCRWWLKKILNASHILWLQNVEKTPKTG